MSKVITFSRVFPKYHPKAGQPTYFVEQIYNSLFLKNNLMDYPKGLEIDETIMGVKKHTIRNGNRWKVGDKFSPRVWSGKPYNSKQIIISPDIEIKQIFEFEIKIVKFDNEPAALVYLDGEKVAPLLLTEIAKNDGLLLEDLINWFQFTKPFKGQIICWSDKINY